jgi:hypothetical protein
MRDVRGLKDDFKRDEMLGPIVAGSARDSDQHSGIKTENYGCQ